MNNLERFKESHQLGASGPYPRRTTSQIVALCWNNWLPMITPRAYFVGRDHGGERSGLEKRRPRRHPLYLRSGLALDGRQNQQLVPLLRREPGQLGDRPDRRHGLDLEEGRSQIYVGLRSICRRCRSSKTCGTWYAPAIKQMQEVLAEHDIVFIGAVEGPITDAYSYMDMELFCSALIVPTHRN